MSSEVVDRFFAAMSAGDLETVRTVFHEDVVSTDFATGQTLTGIEANMADVQNWQATFSDLKVEAVRHTVSGNTVVT